MYYFSPHPKAPLIKDYDSSRLYFTQLVSELSSKSLVPTKEIVDLIRQLSLTSLFFYLKYIAGFSGPYSNLNFGLHLDMCNFRQGKVSMEDGARWAMFEPRGHFKSTVGTHGAIGWEILRNPEIRVRLVCNIVDRAYQYINIIKDTFRNNELFKVVFPEYVLPKNQAEFIVPCRKRYKSEANVMAGGVGGASEGSHHDLLVLDDILGLNELDSGHSSTVSMEYIKNWASTSLNALLDSWKTSRIGIVGTRYAPDDFYQKQFEDCKKLYGYKNSRIVENDNCEWVIYYRKCIEDEEVIFPENFTIERYLKLQKEDAWTFQSQYVNDPFEASIVEFANLPVYTAYKVGDDKYPKIVFEDGEEEGIDVNRMQFVMAIDPAFTDKGITAKTSRTAIEVWGVDGKKRYVLVWKKVGYFDTNTSIDFIIEGLKEWGRWITCVVVEGNAQQKAFAEFLKARMFEEGLFNLVLPKSVGSDKVARIRTGLSPLLARGQVYILNGMGMEFIEEKSMFPQSKYKMDVLDAAEKAVTTLMPPDSDEDEWSDVQDAEYLSTVGSELTGY